VVLYIFLHFFLLILPLNQPEFARSHSDPGFRSSVFTWRWAWFCYWL